MKKVGGLGTLVEPDGIPGNGIYTSTAAGIGAIPFSQPWGVGGSGGVRPRAVVVHGRVHKLDAGGGNITLRCQGNFTGKQVAAGTGASNTLHAKATSTTADSDSVAVATAAPEAQRTITGATNATPIVITASGHGYSNGDLVEIASVGGNTAANGTWRVNVLTANTFELVGSVGSGGYTSGGTANRHLFFTAIFSFGSSASNLGGLLPIPYPYLNLRISNSGAAYSAGNVYIDCVELYG